MARPQIFNLDTCKELQEKYEARRITVHLDKNDFTTYDGIVVFEYGKWCEDAIKEVEQHKNRGPITTKFGAVSTFKCSEEEPA